MAGLEFTTHARQRMEERGITDIDVLKVLAYGERVDGRWNQVWTVSQQSGRCERSVFGIRVVCNSQMRIITVYRR